MEKEKLLKQVRDLSSQGLLSQEELLTAFAEGSQNKTQRKFAAQNRLSAILYFLGAMTVVLGVVVLTCQQWEHFNDITKILITLGSANVAFIVGALLAQEEHLEYLSQGFFFMSGLIMPLGVHVTFDLAGLNPGMVNMQTLISGVLLILYLAAFLIFRKTVLLIFSIIFGSWAYFSFCSFLFSAGSFEHDWKIYSYRILVWGLSLMFLGHYFTQGSLERKTLSKWLTSIGVFSFLGAVLSLGGWSPDQSIFWEFLFPIINFGVIYLSVYLKNQSILFFGSCYLMGYLSKITAEYFSHSIGWAFSLVIMGFIMMGIGYFAFYLHKKYIK